MRPLTEEETASIRRRHGALLLPPGTKVAAYAFPIFLISYHMLKGNWVLVGILVAALGAFEVATYAISRPIRHDLHEGVAESLTGRVEKRRGLLAGFSIRIKGKNLRVPRGMYLPPVGETVTVEFLPRSHEAIRVEKVQ